MGSKKECSEVSQNIIFNMLWRKKKFTQISKDTGYCEGNIYKIKNNGVAVAPKVRTGRSKSLTTKRKKYVINLA